MRLKINNSHRRSKCWFRGALQIQAVLNIALAFSATTCFANTAADGAGAGPNVTVTENGDDTVPMTNGIASSVIVKKTGPAAEESKFFAARGEYRLSVSTTLIISENEQTPNYTLKSAVRQANIATTVSHGGELTGIKPEEPFLFYWDADSQTLWWATPRRLGYCDIRNPQSGKSACHIRTEPFRASFPPRPKAFSTEMERTLKLQP